MIMNNELENMRKVVVLTSLKVLLRHLYGGAEENHENPPSGYSACGQRFVFGTSRIRNGCWLCSV